MLSSRATCKWKTLQLAIPSDEAIILVLQWACKLTNKSNVLTVSKWTDTDRDLVKGIDHPKMKVLSLITHPHVVPNPHDFRSSLEHKWRSFWWILRAFFPSIDSYSTTTLTLQKVHKEIAKLIHMNQAVYYKFVCLFVCFSYFTCFFPKGGAGQSTL